MAKTLARILNVPFALASFPLVDWYCADETDPATPPRIRKLDVRETLQLPSRWLIN